MTDCFFCKKRIGWTDANADLQLMMTHPTYANITIPPGFTEKDKICEECLRSGKIEDTLPATTSNTNTSRGTMPEGFEDTTKQNNNFISKDSGPVTSAAQLRALTQTLHDQTKSQWEKNGVVQYKDEGLVILQRMWGQQVQFIVACSQVTKEGYRLVAIDEGKEGSSGGLSGGVNAYFYFQKMDYVR
jgi:hypothetical protein